MNKLVLLSAVSLAAFANAAPKTAADKAPVVPPVDGAAAASTDAAVSASKRRERTDVKVITASVTTGLPKGVVTARRGKGSKYPFDSLAAPVIHDANDTSKNEYASFGLVGMDKAGFNSTLFSNNKRGKKLVPKVDANGQPVTKQVDVKDATGAVVGHNTQPEMIEVIEREYIAIDVDPKTDKEGASLRVYRIK